MQFVIETESDFGDFPHCLVPLILLINFRNVTKKVIKDVKSEEGYWVLWDLWINLSSI